jgi:hypothetical protein
MNRENAEVPPPDPLLAWVLAELERLEEQDEYPETQLTNEQGTEIT